MKNIPEGRAPGRCTGVGRAVRGANPRPVDLPLSPAPRVPACREQEAWTRPPHLPAAGPLWHEAGAPCAFREVNSTDGLLGLRRGTQRQPQ